LNLTLWGLLQRAAPEELQNADPALASGHQSLCDGSAEAALAAAAAGLRQNAQDPAALLLSADAFTACGRPLEALDLLRSAVAAQPQGPGLQLAMAQQLLNLGRAEEAQLCLQRSLALVAAGDVPSAALLKPILLERLVQALLARNQLEEAWSQIELEVPNYPELAELGADLLLKLNRPLEALPFAQAHASSAPSAQAAELLALCHFRAGDQTAYAELLRQASDREPQVARLASLAAQATFDQAVDAATVEAGWQRLRAGLEEAGPEPELRFLEARQMLLDGLFAQAWSVYEARLCLPNKQLLASCPQPWDGESPNGRSVVVVAEQGVGDVLFFARFLPALQAEAGTVFLLVEPRLVLLLRRSYPQVVVLEQIELARALAGEQALWIPLASLPLRYGTSKEAIAATSGVQLQLQPCLQTRWAQRLEQEAPSSPRLGISLTAGGPTQEYQQRKREVPAEVVLQPLQDRDLTLIDLQHRGTLPLLRFEGLTRDLDQLCALISQLDALITCDQTNAFLGGMLGIPTLVLVPPNPHFMFGRDGGRSLWFDSLRIVRAPRWADWQGVGRAYERELEVMLAGL